MHSGLSITDITGVVLAGGRGRRFGGRDKGLIELNGQPLVVHVLDVLRPQTGKQLISANRNLERYRTLGVPVISDELEGYQGPLAGIAAAMGAVCTPYILTVPCDGPWLAADLAQRLLQALQFQQAELALAHDGERIQPIHALIPINLLPSLQKFLARGVRGTRLWYTEHKIAIVDCSDCQAMFCNINTPEALRLELTARHDG